MAKFVDKVKIETPVKNWRDFDLSCQQLTTQFFMRTGVAYAKEFPAAKIKMNLQSYARMMPLQKPVLGSVQVHNRVFFVPFRTVWRPFTSFLVQAPINTSGGTIVMTQVPLLAPADLLVVLTNYSTQVGVGDAYDFVDLANNPRVLDYQGRHYYKIMRQLGYSPGYNKDVRVSALPLLCFAKLFMDWYYPAQYAHTGTYAFLDGFFNRNYHYTLTASEITNILEATRCTFYGNDYFVSNWESPVAPVYGTFDTGIVIPDITNPDIGHYDYSNVVNKSNGTPFVQGYDNGNNRVTVPYSYTQYVDDSLKALTNAVKRHQLVGARVIDRYLADFQQSLPYESLERSIYVGTQSFPIQFQDVMANSDTVQSSGGVVTGAQLGDYAGKGTAFDGKGNFEFETKEYGYVIVVNDITPDVAYYQGIDRNICHKTFLDFFQPQFEKLGTQVTLQVEANGDFTSDDYESIFGFMPRYAEYKTSRDVVSGLFSVNSKNTGLLAWSTVRQIGVGQTHSFNFLRGDDSWQYARIFYGQVSQASDELDKFIFVHRINLKASLQMSPLYDTYDFDEPEGDEITMQANGTQFK